MTTFLCLLQLLEAQAEYHKKSLLALEAAIPSIRIEQGEDFCAITTEKIGIHKCLLYCAVASGQILLQ